MALEPGTKLGSYHVTALIGEGGMGQVYQATDTKLAMTAPHELRQRVFTDDSETSSPLRQQWWFKKGRDAR